ncbi:hypothetical protein DPEC_G00019270 [Dallia pectoralis]|uniref:Uncharacterized protein n=1 Tax=Dallia pectoralis TaxID=75939 RepID=A0ACC2HFY5_DALPE|nr:hypothetical protein DPEC_G00019270 [Dallia pectoralis]
MVAAKPRNGRGRCRCSRHSWPQEEAASIQAQRGSSLIPGSFSRTSLHSLTGNHRGEKRRRSEEATGDSQKGTPFCLDPQRLYSGDGDR